MLHQKHVDVLLKRPRYTNMAINYLTIVFKYGLRCVCGRVRFIDVIEVTCVRGLLQTYDISAIGLLIIDHKVRLKVVIHNCNEINIDLH